jgi:hypothetical protein
MITSAPRTAFIVLSVVSILLIATIPIVGLTLYDDTEITQPHADAVGDAKINSQNDTLDAAKPQQ